MRVRNEVAVPDRLARPDSVDTAGARRAGVEMKPRQLTKYLLFSTLFTLDVRCWHGLVTSEKATARLFQQAGFLLQTKPPRSGRPLLIIRSEAS